MEAADQTIVHSIREHARRRPDAVALAFVRGEETDATLTYGELDLRARMLGSRLHPSLPEGSLILLPMRSDAESVIGLCACLYAGFPCVPVPFPARNSTTRQLDAIVAASGCAAVIAPDDMAGFARPFADLPVLAQDATGDPGWTPRDPQTGDLAFVQYTSGSTTEPKGVLLSYANVRANLEMLRIALRVGPEDRCASWLPLFHDMGLAMLLMPLYFGVPGAFMAPLSFLRRPERWWQMVDRHAATITGGPNFAFEISASRICSDVVGALDLRRVKLAFCGAEPVRLATMQRFASRFAPAGFRAAAFFPCYGLAEAVCFAAGGHIVADDEITVAEPVATRFPVSCGAPAPGSTIVIVNPLAHVPCAEATIGEIWVAGPHIGGGYLGMPKATQATFRARLEKFPDGRFLRTGDLGFLDNGALTITGRIKDVIIHRGANIHAADVEAVVAACHPGFGPEGAAFAFEVQDNEHVVLVHEAARGFDGQLDEPMLRAALDAVALHHGIRLLDLVLVRAGSIPKTSSGKVRRDACRAFYAQNELRTIGRLRDGRVD